MGIRVCHSWFWPPVCAVCAGRLEGRPSPLAERLDRSQIHSSSIPCLALYFDDDLTFVTFNSKSGIHVLPSAEISRFSTLLMKSEARVIVPLIWACFPPVTCVPV